MTDTRPFWLAGQTALGEVTVDITSPYDRRHVATVGVPTPAQVEQAVAAANAVAAEFAASPLHRRAVALAQVARRLIERAEEMAALIVAENGKPLKWARVEVNRAISVFEWAADETRRFDGEIERLDGDVAGTGRLALVRRVPRGPILGISPFNFPLNLTVHKVAPALAVGAPIIVKPAPATPLSSLLLGELLAETDLPEGSWSVLTVPNDQMPALVADPRLPVVSFTGSVPVGWSIRDANPRKHMALELGGNAAAVVCADYASEADLDHAASQIAFGAYYQAGQSCISVQRVLADATVHDRFAEKLVAAVEALKTGDPNDPGTEVGPMINEAAAQRVEQWVDEAVAAGAKVLTGARRDGTTYAPTVLTDVPIDAKVVREEVFGPVLVLTRFDGTDEGFRMVNDSKFGLQAGVFTRDVAIAFRAHRELQVGGVIIGDVPSFRSDRMPYGGVKDSGVGREGVKYAMEDYTYERVMVFSGLDL